MTGQEALEIGRVGDKVVFYDGVLAEIRKESGEKYLLLARYEEGGEPWGEKAHGYLGFDCEFMAAKSLRSLRSELGKLKVNCTELSNEDLEDKLQELMDLAEEAVCEIEHADQ